MLLTVSFFGSILFQVCLFFYLTGSVVEMAADFAVVYFPIYCSFLSALQYVLPTAYTRLYFVNLEAVVLHQRRGTVSLQTW